MKEVTIEYLQKYIKANDYNPELVEEYFLKLSEEIGELSRAIRKNLFKGNNTIKGTIDEEIWDVIYYTIAIANCYNINITEAIKAKEEINNNKYNSKINYGDKLE